MDKKSKVNITGNIHTGNVTNSEVGHKVHINEINVGTDPELIHLLKELHNLVLSNSKISNEEKAEIIEQTIELEKELQKPQPDIGRLSRLKETLLKRGTWITVTIGAIFSNPSVVKIVEMAAKRLTGES